MQADPVRVGDAGGDEVLDARRHVVDGPEPLVAGRRRRGRPGRSPDEPADVRREHGDAAATSDWNSGVVDRPLLRLRAAVQVDHRGPGRGGRGPVQPARERADRPGPAGARSTGRVRSSASTRASRRLARRAAPARRGWTAASRRRSRSTAHTPRGSAQSSAVSSRVEPPGSEPALVDDRSRQARTQPLAGRTRRSSTVSAAAAAADVPQQRDRRRRPPARPAPSSPSSGLPATGRPRRPVGPAASTSSRDQAARSRSWSLRA